MDTKYNLNITTSGEGGDNATTSITTTDANKLADLLKLAGMSQAHPVALNVSPDEEHDMPCSTCGESPCGCGCSTCGELSPDEEHDMPCSTCGESPCGCGMSEGESWDNEPETFIHSPEEVFKVGDDLHKVKKSYAPVAGGDNPMALESLEDKLRGMYDEFITESEEEVEEAIRVKFRTKKEVPHRARKPLAKEKEMEIEPEEVHEESADLADIRKLAGLGEAAGVNKAARFDRMMKQRSADKEARAINTEKSKRDTAKSAGYDAAVAGKKIGGIAKKS
jgi:hypothetical protein